MTSDGPFNLVTTAKSLLKDYWFWQNSFCWLGHRKMSFSYPTSHEFVMLLYDLFDGLAIFS